jgi:hypothetical protein
MSFSACVAQAPARSTADDRRADSRTDRLYGSEPGDQSGEAFAGMVRRDRRVRVDALHQIASVARANGLVSIGVEF